jgi:hypothetical protein
MKISMYILGWGVACAVLVTLIIRDFEEKRTQRADDLAMCIAEQSYTHPMDDKMEELINAIFVCQRGG